MFVIERNMDNAATRGIADPVGVGEHITHERIASELGRSCVWPHRMATPCGPHRESEEP